MPCDYKDYPENWKQISSQIKARAEDRCELCYAPNGAFVLRIKGEKYPWQMWYEIKDTRPNDKITKIILTVHHIDSDKENNDPKNLIALCQRCHIRLDLQRHIKKAKETRNKKRMANENSVD